MKKGNHYRSNKAISIFLSLLCAVFAVTAAEAGNSYWIETENTGSIIAPMQVGSDTTASGGKFIYIPNGNGTYLSKPGPGVASYTLNIPTGGTYVIWGRVIATSSSDDSFFVQIDNGTDTRWDVQIGNAWHWSKVKNSSATNIAFNLSAGTHKINIKHREDGTKIDKLVLTDDLNFVPIDSVAQCGNNVLEGTEQCDDGNLVSGDGCSAACVKEFCGDKIVQTGLGESCDGNTQSCTTSNGYTGTQNCNTQCNAFDTCVTTQFCGDGTVNGTEQCDDSNTASGDGCSNICVREFCGDGMVQSKLGEICEGLSIKSCTASSGYAGTQSCQSNCTYGSCAPTEYCGDGIVQSAEECDDGNTANGDRCSSVCLIEKISTGLDADGMARVALLENQLSTMVITPTHPRIFLNNDKLIKLRAKAGQATWNAVLAKADTGDLISSALGYLMLEQSDPTRALAYADNVFNSINNISYTNWCATTNADQKSRIDIAMASIAFDWVYNGLSDVQRTILIDKLATAADITAKKNEIDTKIVPKTGPSTCYKGGTKGETFHREEWAFYAYDAWPEIALAHHHPDAETVYKARWGKEWYWGDAARAEVYVNDGTPFEGYYYGNDGVSWFLPLASATGINLIDGPEFHWNGDAAYHMLYRFDIARSNETMHKGAAAPLISTSSFLKSESSTWKLREYISRTFSINASTDPHLQWVINNKVNRYSSWLMSNNYYNSISSLYQISKLLFYDDTATAKDPTTANYAELSFDRYFAGGNEAYMRTGWGSKATIVGFRSKPAFTMSSHSDFDVNTFVIYRDGGLLSPDSGTYDVYDQQQNYFRYQKNTVSHNNLLIIDPANPDGPLKLSSSSDPGGTEQRSTKTFSAQSTSTNNVFTQRKTNPNWADITKFETHPEYAYLVGDAREAYGSRLSQYDRNLAFLRKEGDEAYVIIFDRVAATDAAFKKKWLLHTVNEPVVNGSIVNTEVAGHIETFNGDYMKADNYEMTSTLHAKFLLPANHTVRRVSGETLHTQGTVSVVYGSNQVIGTGTNFTPIMTGHYFHVDKDRNSTAPSGYDGYSDWYQIKSVEDTTHLTLQNAYSHATGITKPYTINQGYQFWVDGTNPQNMFVTGAARARATDSATGRAWQHMGQGRIELMPPDGSKTDYFLVAMYLSDINSPMPVNTVKLESTAGTPMYGALIDNKVVMFSQSGSVVTNTVFKVAHSGTVDALIADLNPGQSYTVLKNGAPISTQTSSTQGTIYFHDDPGTAGATYSIQ